MSDRILTNRGPNTKCTAPNCSERIAVSVCCPYRPPRTLPLPHPAAPLCALSAHTLHKTGEVLTFPNQTKQRLEIATTTKYDCFFRRKRRKKPTLFSCNEHLFCLTGIVPHKPRQKIVVSGLRA